MSTVHADELRKSTATSIGEALIGRLPGLIVKKGSYEPGNEPSIYIRGLNTYGSANTPLVIVDGFRTDYNQLSLYEIESISVLKDAAAVALYGQQAANGVLLVTTKRGFVGKDDDRCERQHRMAGIRQQARYAECVRVCRAAQSGAYQRWPACRVRPDHRPPELR